MAGVSLTGVTRRFGATLALDAVDLAVSEGEFLAVLGPSGCGKTTLLRLLAGFERPDDGTIAIGDATVAAPGFHVPAERRGVGVVFQTYALWPHMTVEGNVGYPLEVRRLARAERRARVEAALATVGLQGFGQRRPAELSGGQRQRVALARCLVMAPRLVLLDEPLANLDVHLRASLQDAIADFRHAAKATMIYVTHDQAEAMALADRVAVMDRGRIVQLAPPAVLYREPASEMVARFVGKGGLVPVRVMGPAGSGHVEIGLLGYPARVRAPEGQKTGPALLCLRPEDLAVATPGSPGFAARVRRTLYQGGSVAVDLEPEGHDGVRLMMTTAPDAAPQPGTTVRLSILGGWIVPESAG